MEERIKKKSNDWMLEQGTERVVWHTLNMSMAGSRKNGLRGRCASRLCAARSQEDAALLSAAVKQQS
jgi:hypothetical protein